MGWYSRLETLTLEASVIADSEWRCISLALSPTIRLDPLAALSVGEYGGWFELRTGLPLAESDEVDPDAGLPLRRPGLQHDHRSRRLGRVPAGTILWTSTTGRFDQWLAVEPSELSFLRGDIDELDCALSDAGGIAEARHEGEDVGVVTCESTIESLFPFEGFPS